jgi:hypothetical protein
MSIEHVSWVIHFSYGCLFAFQLFFMIGKKTVTITVCEELCIDPNRGMKIHYNKIQRNQKLRVSSEDFKKYSKLFENVFFKMDMAKGNYLLNSLPPELTKCIIDAQKEDMKNV